MLKLSKPLHQAQKHFLTCLATSRDRDTRECLEGIAPCIGTACGRFDTFARKFRIFDYRSPISDSALRQKLRQVYTNGMSRRKSPGRQLYDSILLSSPFQRCVFCAQRIASTIDHYLPRHLFPELSVAPTNLVPCCSECNHKKGRYAATTEHDQIPHPYFQDLGGGVWLIAVLEKVENEFQVTFRVEPLTVWPERLAVAVRNYFDLFSLNELYAIHALTELGEIELSISRIRATGGRSAVRAHLMEEAESISQINPNSWRAAAYRAFADSEEYCGG